MYAHPLMGSTLTNVGVRLHNSCTKLQVLLMLLCRHMAYHYAAMAVFFLTHSVTVSMFMIGLGHQHFVDHLPNLVSDNSEISHLHGDFHAICEIQQHTKGVKVADVCMIACRAVSLVQQSAPSLVTCTAKFEGSFWDSHAGGYCSMLASKFLVHFSLLRSCTVEVRQDSVQLHSSSLT